MEQKENTNAVEGGGYLRRQRRALDISQDTMEREAGVSNQVISQIEKGRIQHPKMETLVRMGEVLGLTPNQLAEIYGYWKQPGEVVDLRITRLTNWLSKVDEAERERLLDNVNTLVDLSMKNYGA